MLSDPQVYIFPYLYNELCLHQRYNHLKKNFHDSRYDNPLDEGLGRFPVKFWIIYVVPEENAFQTS